MSSRRSRIRASTDGAGFRKCSRAASTIMLLPTPGRSVATSSRPQTPSLSRTVTLRRAEALRLREGRRSTRSAFASRSASCCSFRQSPKSPRSRARHRDTIDEVNRLDGNYRKDRRSIGSTEQSGRPCSGVEKERRCGIALTATEYRCKGKRLLNGFPAKRLPSPNERLALTIGEQSPLRVRLYG